MNPNARAAVRAANLKINTECKTMAEKVERARLRRERVAYLREELLLTYREIGEIIGVCTYRASTLYKTYLRRKND